MPHAYTEDQLVEQSAIGLFAEFGWQVASPTPKVGVAGEPRDAGLLGRETKGEVLRVARWRAAMEKLDPTLPPVAITAPSEELPRLTRKCPTWPAGSLSQRLHKSEEAS